MYSKNLYFFLNSYTFGNVFLISIMQLHTFPWQTILDWYLKNWSHFFPWREYDSLALGDRLYRVWISEILLQQTQAQRVIPYFTSIIKTFPSIHTLAKSDYDTFFPYYKWMGYYSRARNILKTAKIVDADFWGVFPSKHARLVSLPGIWEYTARAIRAFGYGETVLAWDTNLEKIFSRFFFGTKNIPLTSKIKAEIESDYINFIKKKKDPKKAVRDINNALMDFGREIDKKTAQEIDWERYPVKMGQWYNTRGSNEKNIKKSRDAFPMPDARIIAILHENHRLYFSENTKKYSPFTIPPAQTRNIRWAVKQYFLQTHWLEVSVRPAHKKWLSSKGEPFLAVNVQVQTWNHTFHTYKKQEAKDIMSTLYNN